MKIKYTQKTFLEKIKLIHNNFYDYSKVIFTKVSEKIIIICPKHGEFEQIANNHLKGNGCKKCGYESQSKIKISNTIDWINKAKLLHGNFYDYSKVVYKHSKEKVIIICPIHGEFEQLPNSHLNGKNCYECSKIKNSLDKILIKAKKIHNNFFIYDKLIFTKVSEKVIIICPIHGEFEQRLNSHLNGNGCPNCSIRNSSYEQELLNFLKNMKINYIQSERKILNGFELDFYLPDYKLAIEINGLYWHSNKFKNNNYHLLKTEKCLSKGIKLIHIFEDEWIHKKQIILSRLNYLTNNIKNKISARKCIIKEISINEIKIFLKNNSLNSFIETSINIGLFFNNELISILSIKENKNKNKNYEITNYCNKINLLINGGFSKLLKYFENKYLPIKINTNCDIRLFSDINIFTKNNFKLINKSQPKSYCIDLNKQLRFEDIIQNNSYKIYDCGNLIYEKQEF